jgi:hypothetical protein
MYSISWVFLKGMAGTTPTDFGSKFSYHTNATTMPHCSLIITLLLLFVLLISGIADPNVLSFPLIHVFLGFFRVYFDIFFLKWTMGHCGRVRRWRLFQNAVARTKFDIYVFIFLNDNQQGHQKDHTFWGVTTNKSQQYVYNSSM